MSFRHRAALTLLYCLLITCWPATTGAAWVPSEPLTFPPASPVAGIPCSPHCPDEPRLALEYAEAPLQPLEQTWLNDPKTRVIRVERATGSDLSGSGLASLEALIASAQEVIARHPLPLSSMSPEDDPGGRSVPTTWGIWILAIASGVALSSGLVALGVLWGRRSRRRKQGSRSPVAAGQVGAGAVEPSPTAQGNTRRHR